MKIVVLGGYGNMGTVITRDLSESFDGEIVIAGRDIKKASAFAKSLKKKNVRGMFADLSKQDSMKTVLRNADVLVNASNFQYNIDAMEAALSSGTHYIDLGGLYHVTKKQLMLDAQFKKNDVIGILGCGSSPGITNIMALYGSEQLDRIDSIGIQFADRDYTKYDRPFVLPYTLQTLFDEFSVPPQVFKNGKMTTVPPLSGKESIKFPNPVGTVDCFYAIHSEIATLPGSFSSKGIKNCSFREGFAQSFVDKIKFMIDAGLASDVPIDVHGIKVKPRDLVDKIMQPSYTISPKTKINDVEYLRVELNGASKGQRKTVIVYCKAVTNKRWNISAGSVDTGVSPSIIAQMIAHNEIERVGVYAPETGAIDPKSFFRELEKREMKISIEVLSGA